MCIALVIAPETDVHAFAVQNAANEIGRNVLVIDPALQGTEYSLSTSIGQGGTKYALEFFKGQSLDLSSIQGLWWRRPFEKNGTPASSHPAVDHVVRKERRQALFGTFSASVKNQFNLPHTSRAAAFKVQQLALARSLGFTIPDTLISDNVDDVRAWCSERAPVVFKMFNGVDFGILETRVLLEEHLGQIWRVASCPVIFQQYVQGIFDVRATVVGNCVFAARLDYPDDSPIVDTRLTQKEAQSVILPMDLQLRLVRLVSTLGLRYGAIDLRYVGDGSWTFFEVNPEGQYLWTEIEAELPISRQIVSELFSASMETQPIAPI